MTHMPKSLEKQISQREPNRVYVLVFDEKYDTDILDATGDKIWESALKKVQERVDNRWWPTLEEATNSYRKHRKEPELSKEEIDKLPDGGTKTAALGFWRQTYETNKYYEDEMIFAKRVKEALDNQDGILAYVLLDHRKAYEYENFEFRKVR